MPSSTSGSRLSEISKSSFVKVHTPHSNTSSRPDQSERLPVIRESRISFKPGQNVSSREFGKSQFHLPSVKSKVQPTDQSTCTIGRGDSTESIQCCENLRRLQLLDTSSSQLDKVPSECLDQLEKGSFGDIVPGADELGVREDEMEESRALKRWEYWMKDKKRMQNYLSKRLGKKPWNLMMQASDKYREALERNFLIWYSEIPKSETERAYTNPRWKLIKNKRASLPCAEKKTLNTLPVPSVEFIGLSNLIKKEKGIVPKEEEEEKEKKVDCKTLHIKRILSHEIHMDQLAVVGVNPLIGKMQSQKPLLFENLPQIIEPNLEDFKNLSLSNDDERTSVFCIAINDSEIKHEIGGTSCLDLERRYIWHVDFGVNLAGSTAEKELRIENRGTMAVKYDWLSTRNERKSSLGALQPKHYESWFFFNKNSGCFLPGQVYNLKFYFQPKTSGIQKETWKLKTDPPLSKKADVASVVLSGVGTEEMLSKTEPLQCYLQRRVVETTISSVIDIILCKVFDSYRIGDDIEYRSIFNEKQLFEYHNPKHYYYSEIVKQLKTIFEQIPNKTVLEWDLSFSSLCQLIPNYGDHYKRCSTFKEVAKKALDLLRPRCSLVRDGQKYRMTYGILCKMTNFMEDDYQYLQSAVSQKIEYSTGESDLGEAKERTIGGDIKVEELGEGESRILMLEIKPINFMFFKALFYIKVYYRMCEAVESIAGVLETRKLFQPWKSVNHRLPKPSRKRLRTSEAVADQMQWS